MQQILAKLAAEKHLVGLDIENFVDRAAYFIGELNAAHPFREGNGRTQREFIRELGLKASHYIDWRSTTVEKMTEASRLSHLSGESSLFASLIRRVHPKQLSPAPPLKRSGSRSQVSHDDLLFWFPFSRIYEPQRFRWVEEEAIVRWRCGWLTSLHRRDSSLDFVVARSMPGMQSRSFENNGRRYRYAARDLAGGIPPPSGSLAHEIVDCAFRNVKPQFISEDVCDIPIRQPAATQLVYQVAVRLQTGPPRLLGYLAQNVVKFVFHRPPNLHQHAPDRTRTSSGQKPDNDRTGNALRGPAEPKPQGLGMVSISK